MDAIMVRWRRLSTTLADNGHKIQELMAKLMQFEVGLAGLAHAAREPNQTRPRG